jgi:hypothetical protein
MRVQCPHCKQNVTLPNEKAEQAVSCPACGQIFTAPAMMNALPDEPAPTPPARQFVPPVSPPVSPAPAPSSAPPIVTGSGLEPCCRLTISKRVVHWIGPIALLVLFVLSFFTWVAGSPAGQTVYSQSAWGVFGGVFSTDITGERVLNRESDLKHYSSLGWSMILALLLMIPTMLIGLGELIEKYHKIPIPDAIEKLWPKRMPALAGASLFIFLMLSFQITFGLGLESAAKAMAENRFPVPAETETTEQSLNREFKRAEEISRLGIRRTGWLWLAYLSSAAAAAGFALELALEHRGARPEPVIEFKW